MVCIINHFHYKLVSEHITIKIWWSILDVVDLAAPVVCITNVMKKWTPNRNEYIKTVIGLDVRMKLKFLNYVYTWTYEFLCLHLLY